MGSLVAFVAGALFAVGLVVSGMTDGNNIIAFLDVAGDWNPELALVMVGAIATHAVGIPLLRKRARPRFMGTYPPLKAGKLDARLVLGATLFGVGWGLGGVCPGPAFVMAPGGDVGILIFFGATLLGIWGYERVTSRKFGVSGGASAE
ncbi:MAG: DUF6691 family protein [Nannocystaceae bacterium]